MKKTMALLVLTLSTLTITAQEHRDSKRNSYTPKEMATLHTKKMVLKLDLDKNQETKIYALNLENATLRKKRSEAIKTRKENVERVKPTSKERYKLANERLDHKIKVKRKMKEILTPEQYDKWNSANKRKHHSKKRRTPTRRMKHQ